MNISQIEQARAATIACIDARRLWSEVETTAPLTVFPKTYCSQCNGEFGPGISGYSSCSEHRAPEPRITFHSHELNGQITCTYAADDEVTNYQFAILTGQAELLSVFVGGVDMTQHMLDTSMKVIGFELGAALQKQAERAMSGLECTA